MAKVKMPRKSISLDMTAMCDMAFLLLTFFILTATMKPDDPVIVDTPSSVSDIKLPDSDILTISIDKDGKVFFGVDGQFVRESVIQSMAKKYGATLSPAQIHEYSLLSAVGSPMSQIGQLLSMKASERNKVKQIGIPCDSVNNELRDWIAYARYANTKLRIAIRGDQDANYSVAKTVIQTLQDQNINKFNFITNLEAKPKK
jgi:biopolymer transport protein ExbD